MFLNGMRLFPTAQRIVTYSYLLAVVALTSVTIYSIKNDYNRKERQVEENMKNLGRAFGLHVDTIFTSLEETLDATTEHLFLKNKKSWNQKEFYSYFNGHIQRKEYLFNLAFVDPTGAPIITGRSEKIPPFQTTNLFTHTLKDLKKNKIRSAVLSEVVDSLYTDAHILPMIKPLWDPVTDEFLGAVVATISPSYFEKYRRVLSVPASSAIYIMTKDGKLLVRAPEVKDYKKWQESRSGDYQSYFKGKSEGFFEAHSQTDSVKKYTYFLLHPDNKIYSFMSLPKSKMLSAWAKGSRERIFLATIVFIILSILYAKGLQYLRRAQELESEKNRNSQAIDIFKARVFNKVGEDFFPALCLALHELTNIKFIMIARVDSNYEVGHSIAFTKEDSIVSNITYNLKGTPCYDLPKQEGVLCIAKNVQQLYPESPLVRTENLDSYIGITITDNKNNPIGLIAGFSSEPIEDIKMSETLFALAAARGQAELLRLASEEARKESEEQKRIAEVQVIRNQKIQAIGSLSSGIAHDFNNILTSIYGHLEIASNKLGRDHPAQINLQKIFVASERAKKLIKQILQFSKRDEDTPHPVSLNKMLEEVYELMKAVIPSSIDFKIKLPDSEVMILGDPSQIHQILMNLTTNAWHAVGDTGKIEYILKKTFIRGKEQAFIEVKDNGIGISAENIPRVFEPFFTTKKNENGTGLGLSVVKNIVEKLQGHIDVESTAQSGTSFKIHFPIYVDEAPSASFELTAKSHPVTHTGQKVLLVDDEVELTDMMKEIIVMEGYEVHAFNDPRLALQEYKKDPNGFFLVITDMTMPGIPGDVLLSEVKKLNTHQEVLVISGFSHRLSQVEDKKDAHTHLLMKPFSYEKFIGHIKDTAHRLEIQKRIAS